MSGMQAVMLGGRGPQCSDVGFAVVGRLLDEFGRLLTLLVHVHFDHLRCQACCQPAVLAALKQSANDEVRAASRSEANKPAVLRQVFIVLMFCACRQRNYLRRTGFAGYVYSRNMR